MALFSGVWSSRPNDDLLGLRRDTHMGKRLLCCGHATTSNYFAASDPGSATDIVCYLVL